jgi:sec-independent protein translocase protein TatC
MATALRPVGYEDRLSLVEHLTELRTRLIVCVIIFLCCFGVCAWQNDAILDLMDRPLERTALKDGGRNSKDPLEQTAFLQRQQRKLALREAALMRALAREESTSPQVAALAQAVARQATAVARATPTTVQRRPVTLGVGEPFTATVRVAAYAALLLALPFLLYQLYAFVLPAFSPTERKVATPLMIAVPMLFIAGVVFGYFTVLPSAINFLQNFNDDNFDILLQARDYYRFAILLLAAMGLVFQIPIAVLAVTRIGLVSVAQLRRTRRYALVVIAGVAMLLPGTDPVTMLILMAPMVILYEGSILFAAVLDRRASRRED